MSQTVDAMGKQCPIPVVMARQALQGMQTPDTLVVLVDNEVAVQNLTKLAGSCHLPVRAEKLGDKRFEVTMDVAAPVTPEPDAEVCLPDQRGDTVIAVGSDRMGIIFSNSHSCRGRSLPTPRSSVMAVWPWQLIRPGTSILPVMSFSRS